MGWFPEANISRRLSAAEPSSAVHGEAGTVDIFLLGMIGLRGYIGDILGMHRDDGKEMESTSLGFRVDVSHLGCRVLLRVQGLGILEVCRP